MNFRLLALGAIGLFQFCSLIGILADEQPAGLPLPVAGEDSGEGLNQARDSCRRMNPHPPPLPFEGRGDPLRALRRVAMNP